MLFIIQNVRKIAILLITSAPRTKMYVLIWNVTKDNLIITTSPEDKDVRMNSTYNKEM